MKRDLINYVLIGLLVLVSCLFNFRNSDIKNIIIDNDNYYVMYPYFNEEKLDLYIDSFIKDIISDDSNNVFLDYDYDIKDEIIDVKFYEYSNWKRKIHQIIYDNNDIVVNKIEDNHLLDVTNSLVNTIRDKYVVFTFDDGINYNTKRILEVLDHYQVHASFFIVGNTVNNYNKTLMDIYNSGNDIGNHSYSHKELTRISRARVIDEIEKTNSVIFNVIGEYPKYLRPSYGSVNNFVKNNSGMPIVIWNLDTKDWKHHNSNYIVNKIINNVDDGDIILMHDIYSATYNAVKKVIPLLYEKGYNIVSITELANIRGTNLENGHVYSRLR